MKPDAGNRSNGPRHRLQARRLQPLPAMNQNHVHVKYDHDDLANVSRPSSPIWTTSKYVLFCFALL
jgi:hypothetical protein